MFICSSGYSHSNFIQKKPPKLGSSTSTKVSLKACKEGVVPDIEMKQLTNKQMVVKAKKVTREGLIRKERGIGFNQILSMWKVVMLTHIASKTNHHHQSILLWMHAHCMLVQSLAHWADDIWWTLCEHG